MNENELIEKLKQIITVFLPDCRTALAKCSCYTRRWSGLPPKNIECEVCKTIEAYRNLQRENKWGTYS